MDMLEVVKLQRNTALDGVAALVAERDALRTEGDALRRDREVLLARVAELEAQVPEVPDTL